MIHWEDDPVGGWSWFSMDCDVHSLFVGCLNGLRASRQDLESNHNGIPCVRKRLQGNNSTRLSYVYIHLDYYISKAS